jgi:hypothetical protein
VFRNVSYVFAVLLGLAAAQAPDWQARLVQSGSPSVSVLLPPSVPSETVQIVYQLTGPFGGVSSYADPKPDLHSYEIDASVDGKAARDIRMIVYAPGCEIQTFFFSLKADSAIKQEFECQHVPAVLLSGQIVPDQLVRNNKNAELDVDYMAPWGDRFFGILDGAVLYFKIASVRLDAKGRFQVKLPYFDVDSKLSRPQPGYQSSFHLSLCDSDTGNPIAWNLEPELSDFASEVHELEIRPFYPAGLRFKVHPSNSPEPQNETPGDGSQP